MRMTIKAGSCENTNKKLIPLNEEQKELAAQNVSVAIKIARRFSRSWRWMHDDLESTAMLALVECARNFDPSYNVKFATFAKYRITGALINYRKRFVQAHKKQISGNTEDSGEWYSVKTSSNLNIHEIRDLEIKSDNSSHHDIYRELYEIRDEVEGEINRLPGLHQSVMREIYLNHRSLKATSKVLGYSLSRVFAIHRESLQMIRENIEYLNRFTNLGPTSL